MKSDLPVSFRSGQKEDADLIFSSWLRSFKRFRFKGVDAKTYFTEHHRLISALLSRSHVVCAVMSVDGEDLILGWICFEPKGEGEPAPVLHYVYVKQTYRGEGLGTVLLTHLGPGPFQFTHDTDAFQELMHRGTYNPYLLWRLP